MRKALRGTIATLPLSLLRRDSLNEGAPFLHPLKFV
jgi:hypothetical protein